MTSRKTTQTYQTHKRWFFAALSMLLVVSSLYAYFVISSVVHVVMRKELDREIADLGSYVSQLEARYIDAQLAVSTLRAEDEGYVVAMEKTFIDASAPAVALSR